MRPFGVWFGRLAMAGACLLGAGCGGGGDVPDPDSDSRAASADSPRVAPKPREEAAAPEAPAKPEPTALAGNRAPAETEKTAEIPKTEAAESEKAAPATKGDASGTDEMLRMAGPQGATPSAGETPGGSGSASAGPGRGEGRDRPSGSAGGLPVSPLAMNPTNQSGGSGSVGTGPSTNSIPPYGGPGSGGSGAQPGVGSGSAPGAGGPVARRPGMMQPGMASGPVPPEGNAGSGGSGGIRPPAANGDMIPAGFGGQQAPGMAGNGDRPVAGGPMAGGPGSNSSAPLDKNAFMLPNTAVNAFLAALKAKDKSRLAQTTAKRAPTEADEKHRKIFAAVVEESISDDELDEMARALEGFQVVTVLPAKSSRRIGVVVAKMVGQERLQRTIVTRQEIDGWKVLDIEQLYDFKPGMSMRRGKANNRR